MLGGMLLAMPACKEVDATANDGKTVILQDSLATVFPTYTAVQIVVSEDRSKMNLVIGDGTFYNATPEVKAQKAAEFGKMVIRIYGKDAQLKTGTLVVTKNGRNKEVEPKDGIATPIDFEALKK